MEEHQLLQSELAIASASYFWTIVVGSMTPHTIARQPNGRLETLPELKLNTTAM